MRAYKKDIQRVFMHPIMLLDPHLINQISAGEVVERPASVLKELLENAVDSRPSRILVRWRQGGQSLLEVEDDGCGIPKNQMRLALARHATSKLRTKEDLNAIATFGFRGEALAAVAAISRLSLTTRHADEEHAWSLSVHAGQEMEFLPSNREKGTSVHVRDLFFSTPARLKFLRSVALEQQHLWDIVHKIILAHPDITFSIHSDTRIMEYPVGIEQRLQDVWGKGFWDNAFYVDQERSGYHLTGWVGLPTYHRAVADRQFFFINARTVKDKVLGSALRVAFGDTMPKGRHPVGVLFLNVPCSDVDVNVHPAKTEVRFLDPRFVRAFVIGVLKEGVWKNGLRASTWLHHATEPENTQAGSPADSKNPELRNNHEPQHETDHGVQQVIFSGMSHRPVAVSALCQVEAMVNSVPEPCVKKHDKNALEKTAWTFPLNHEFNGVAPHGPYTKQRPIYDPTIAREVSYFVPNQGGQPENTMRVQASESSTESLTEPIFVDLGQAVMQIQGGYIVARNPVGLVLVDPHAAHERIVYERMKTEWLDDIGHVQTLLIPILWPITETEQDHMQSIQESMQKLGFAYVLSDKTCALQSIPGIFHAYDPEKLCRDVVSCVQEGDSEQDIVLSWRNHMMANWACRQSLKLGQTMTLDAMNTLLRTLERTPHGAQCNHGRCVYRMFSAKDLARMFDR